MSYKEGARGVPEEEEEEEKEKKKKKNRQWLVAKERWENMGEIRKEREFELNRGKNWSKGKMKNIFVVRE